MYNSFREEESREERRRRRRGGDDETSASVDEDVRSPDITFYMHLEAHFVSIL